MTIDEVIAREREAAEIHRNGIVSKENYQNMPRIGKDNEESMRNAEEHEQLADWLEELKMYRESSYGKLYGMVYNKAIDDFMKKSEYLLCENLIYQEMEDIAGRLKAGVDNDD